MGTAFLLSLVHGMTAGWGFAALAIFVDRVLTPAGHRGSWGWLPWVCSRSSTMAPEVIADGLIVEVRPSRQRMLTAPPGCAW